MAPADLRPGAELCREIVNGGLARLEVRGVGIMLARHLPTRHPLNRRCCSKLVGHRVLRGLAPSMAWADGTSQPPCSAPPEFPLLTETAWVSSCTLAGEGLNFIEGGMAKARDRDRAWR